MGVTDGQAASARRVRYYRPDADRSVRRRNNPFASCSLTASITAHCSGVWQTLWGMRLPVGLTERHSRFGASAASACRRRSRPRRLSERPTSSSGAAAVAPSEAVSGAVAAAASEAASGVVAAASSDAASGAPGASSAPAAAAIASAANPTATTTPAEILVDSMGGHLSEKTVARRNIPDSGTHLNPSRCRSGCRKLWSTIS